MNIIISLVDMELPGLWTSPLKMFTFSTYLKNAEASSQAYSGQKLKVMPLMHIVNIYKQISPQVKIQADDLPTLSIVDTCECDNEMAIIKIASLCNHLKLTKQGYWLLNSISMIHGQMLQCYVSCQSHLDMPKTKSIFIMK